MEANRLALALSYEGTLYHGWQAQENLANLQNCLEAALTQVADHPVRVMCAGRTDAGVHASEQVVHFDTTAQRNEQAWLMGTNSYLPPDMSVQWVKSVPAHFHARSSAQSRCYRYLIYNSLTRPGILNTAVAWHYRSLDIEAMEQAAQVWVGEHDFSSFRGPNCQSKTPVRNMHRIRVYRQNQIIVIEIIGNAFLHHMVRNMVGVLLLIGQGKKNPEWALEVLNAKDRRAGAMMAPAKGLYLVKVSYPEEFGLPQTPLGPFFSVPALKSGFSPRF